MKKRIEFESMNLFEALFWTYKIGYTQSRLENLKDKIEDYTQNQNFEPEKNMPDRFIQEIKDEILFLETFMEP